MRIRTIQPSDTEPFYEMLCRLDDETDFMLYEPGERQEKTPDLNRLKAAVEAAVQGDDLLLVAIDGEEEIIGYLWAQRGSLRRTQHTAYIVTGIRKTGQGKGIGTELFKALDDWAQENGLVRLELTVESANTVARRLYEKQGFVVEGLRSKSMKVKGELVDELYMAKLIGI